MSGDPWSVRSVRVVRRRCVALTTSRPLGLLCPAICACVVEYDVFNRSLTLNDKVKHISELLERKCGVRHFELRQFRHVQNLSSLTKIRDAKCLDTIAMHESFSADLCVVRTSTENALWVDLDNSNTDGRCALYAILIVAEVL